MRRVRSSFDRSPSFFFLLLLHNHFASKWLRLMFGLHTIQLLRSSWLSQSQTLLDQRSSPLTFPSAAKRTLQTRRFPSPFSFPFFLFQRPSFSSPSTSSFSSGDEGIRTPDLRRAKAALSQLSYIPNPQPVGLSGLEPETLPLSEARSNQLS